jgi:hypothetical protein
MSSYVIKLAVLIREASDIQMRYFFITIVNICFYK